MDDLMTTTANVQAMHAGELNVPPGLNMDLRCEFVRITPAMAASWLRLNKRNRKLSPKQTTAYARAMTEGQWRLNGQAICFGRSGLLLDGQHRLAACMESGVSFIGMVVWGVDDDAFDTIDIGKKRTVGDILSIDGVENANNTAAAVRVILAVQNGQPLPGRPAPTPTDVRNFLEDHPEFFASVKHCHQKMPSNVLEVSTAIGLHFLFAQVNRDDADVFFGDLFRGTGLDVDDPVWQLRESLYRERGQRNRRNRHERAMQVMRTWNMRRRGQTTKQAPKGSIAGDKNYPVFA